MSLTKFQRKMAIALMIAVPFLILVGVVLVIWLRFTSAFYAIKTDIQDLWWHLVHQRGGPSAEVANGLINNVEDDIVETGVPTHRC